ncbi:MAG: transglycosylase domain-containing protein [Anaerolineae bacterium]
MTNRTQQIILWRQKRRRHDRQRPHPWRWLFQFSLSGLAIFFLIFGGGALTATAAAAGVYVYFAQNLPDAAAIETEQEDFATVKIFDRTGQHLLYESIDPRPFRGDRTYLPLNEMSPWLAKATIALEDRSFYENPGINLRGLGRAFVSNLQGNSVQGASSITQQLVKNVLIPPEERVQRSYTRKIKEAIMAVEVTRRYPKDQILEWYLNYNFYGNAAYGVEAAARIYFDKSAADVTLAEAAMLSALPQYPGLNPIQSPEDAYRRQRKVVDALAEAGYISAAEAEEAKAYADTKPLAVRLRAAERFEYLDAPHFSLYVLDELRRAYNTADDPYFIWRNGLQVYTTLDLDLQKKAEEVARAQVAKVREKNNVHNASVVALRPTTGEIVAMVGSLDYNDEENDGEVNVAISNRQPGSSFKLFTYLTALQQGYTPASMIVDVRTVFPDAEAPYVPENYDRKYHGPQFLRDALARSYNIPAVWMLSKVGVKNVINTAHKMGITTLRDDYYGLALTLGGGEVKLLDMVYAFSLLANGGVMAGDAVPAERQAEGLRTLDPVSILQVRDKNGLIIYEYKEPKLAQVVSPQVAYVMSNILSDTAARWAAFGRPNDLEIPGHTVAAKTGTTNNWHDNWTVGYTPQLAVGVWVGNTDNEPMDKISGLTGAAPIWNQVMTYGLNNMPDAPFVQPPGIRKMTVCYPSGLLPTAECQQKRTEIFIEGSEPKTYDTVWRAFEVNRETGKLSTPYTPPELIERRIYQILPPEAADWVVESAIPQPPSEYDTAYGQGPVNDEVAIISPGTYNYVKGLVPITGNARAGDFRNYRVEFGEGLNPGAWTQIGPEHGDQKQNDTLEFWDTSALDGLYTVRLSVTEGSGNARTAATQVTVDNTAPRVEIEHPFTGKLYVMEDDEWVSITANAHDNWSMDRADFYLDQQKIGSSTVAPFNVKWTIKMLDLKPVPGSPPVMGTEVITNTDGTTTTQEIVVSEVVVDPQGRIIQRFHSGMSAIVAAGKYTETHQIYIEAFDSAGNSTKTDPITILVTHKAKKKATAAPLSWLLPVRLGAADEKPAPAELGVAALAWLRPVDGAPNLADNRRPRGTM